LDRPDSHGKKAPSAPNETQGGPTTLRARKNTMGTGSERRGTKVNGVPRKINGRQKTTNKAAENPEALGAKSSRNSVGQSRVKKADGPAVEPTAERGRVIQGEGSHPPRAATGRGQRPKRCP